MTFEVGDDAGRKLPLCNLLLAHMGMAVAGSKGTVAVEAHGAPNSAPTLVRLTSLVEMRPTVEMAAMDSACSLRLPPPPAIAAEGMLLLWRRPMGRPFGQRSLRARKAAFMRLTMTRTRGCIAHTSASFLQADMHNQNVAEHTH